MRANLPSRVAALEARKSTRRRAVQWLRVIVPVGGDREAAIQAAQADYIAAHGAPTQPLAALVRELVRPIRGAGHA